MTRRQCVLSWMLIMTLVLLGAPACDAFVTPAPDLAPPPTPAGSPAGTPAPSPAGPTPISMPPEPTPTTTPSSGTPVAAVPLAGQTIRSFRFLLVISDTMSTGTEVTRMEGEWTTDALHMITTASAGEGEEKVESYLIGDTAYFQDPQGRWQSGSSGNPEFRTLMNPTQVLEDGLKQKELTLSSLGTSTVDGIACVRYQVTPQGEATEAGSLFVQGIAYVGVGDGWVHRFEFERTDEGVHSEGVMTCYDYNSDITIRPPI